MGTFWPESVSLSEALQQVLDRFHECCRTRDDFAKPLVPEACTSDEIVDHERQLEFPLPAPFHELYERLNGIEFGPELLPPPVVFLHQISDTKWLQGETVFGPEPGAWACAKFFMFAQGMYGDEILYCDEPVISDIGKVFLASHRVETAAAQCVLTVFPF